MAPPENKNALSGYGQGSRLRLFEFPLTSPAAGRPPWSDVSLISVEDWALAARAALAAGVRWL
jgi:hypothetical protein